MKSFALTLLSVLSLAGHADVILQEPRWTPPGTVELSVALGTAAAKPRFEILKIEQLALGKTETVTSGAVTAVVRLVPGTAPGEQNLMTVAVTIDGFVSKANVPLTALFIARQQSDQQFRLLSPTPVLDAAGLFANDLHWLIRGLKDSFGCTEAGVLVVLNNYARAFPGQMIKAAMLDANNYRFKTPAGGGACADLPDPVRVIDPNASSPAAAATTPAPATTKAEPAAPKKRYRQLPDGTYVDTYNNDKPWVEPSVRAPQPRPQRQRPQTYDRGDDYGYGQGGYGRGGYGRGGYDSGDRDQDYSR